jgi:hypothetical protein
MDMLDSVNLVVELQPSLLSSINDIKASFDTSKEPVVAFIESRGGKILGEAWINSTLKVELDASRVDELKALAMVKKVSTPRPLQAD